jgi:DNA-binding IclR family transcriptional regulator
MKPIDPDKVKSADRVLNVLELLARSGRPMSHAEIARRTDVPKSSLTHLLRNLIQRGYVAMDEATGAFLLGESAFALSRRGAKTREIVTIAQPLLKHLTVQTGESSGLSLLCDDMAERVCGVDSTGATLYAMHVGVQAPLYANSAGKIFLAWMSARERESYLERVKLEPLTAHTVRSASALRRQLQTVKTDGVAYSYGEFTPGIVGIAVPVLDVHSRAVAAAGIAMPAVRLEANQRLKARLADALQNCARSIARRLSAA